MVKDGGREKYAERGVKRGKISGGREATVKAVLQQQRMRQLSCGSVKTRKAVMPVQKEDGTMKWTRIIPGMKE